MNNQVTIDEKQNQNVSFNSYFVNTACIIKTIPSNHQTLPRLGEKSKGYRSVTSPVLDYMFASVIKINTE